MLYATSLKAMYISRKSTHYKLSYFLSLIYTSTKHKNYFHSGGYPELTLYYVLCGIMVMQPEISTDVSSSEYVL